MSEARIQAARDRHARAQVSTVRQGASEPQAHAAHETSSKPRPARLEPVSDDTLQRMVRYALLMGGERLEFWPGRRPWMDGMGGPRELRHRQLTVDDTGAIADFFLARGELGERLRACGEGGAALMPLLVEMPNEALLEARLSNGRGGLRVAVDVIRPLPEAERRALARGL